MRVGWNSRLTARNIPEKVSKGNIYWISWNLLGKNILTNGALYEIIPIKIGISIAACIFLMRI